MQSADADKKPESHKKQQRVKKKTVAAVEQHKYCIFVDLSKRAHQSNLILLLDKLIFNRLVSYYAKVSVCDLPRRQTSIY